MDQAPDTILLIDQNAQIKYANKRACGLLGYSGEEFQSMALKDIQPGVRPESWANRWKQYEQAEISENVQLERLFLHKAGHFIPVEISANHVRLEKGSLHVAFLRDITERKSIEKKLKLTQHSLDEASIGCFWVDDEGRIIYANDKACKLLGYSQTELLDKFLFDVDERLKGSPWGTWWQQICDKKNLTFEALHKRKDGSTLFVENSTTLLEYEGHQFAANFIQDITRRKQDEQRLRLTQFCFDKAFIEIFLIGPDGMIKAVNDQACKNLGYSQDELCQMRIFDIAPRLKSARWSAHRKKIREDGFGFGESVHRRKDGTLFPVEVMINLMEYDDGEYAISFARDITEIKELEQERKQLEDRINQVQKMEALGTLAGGIAHDFNNILSAIYGFTELAKINSKEGTPLHGYIQQIFVASERAKKLVKQILLFSRQDRTEKRPTDLGTIVREAVKMIRASIPTTIDIQHDIKSNLGAVYADSTQVHQTIINLCTNAYHAMKNSGGSLRIGLAPIELKGHKSLIVGELQPGRYLELTVVDTGHGMDEEVLSHIFEPYFSTKEPGEGTGMGLSTVLGIMKDHGGAIDVFSRPGQGTSFRLFFPLVDMAPSSKKIPPAMLPQGDECILFVDDEVSIVETTKAILEKFGYSVEARLSAYDALEAFRSRPEKYHLLITDMAMPKMPGDILVAEIRKIRPDLPVIICTGFSERINQDMLNQLNVKTVLFKPTAVDNMVIAIRTVLDEASGG